MIENKSLRIINYIVDIIFVSVLSSILNLVTSYQFYAQIYLLTYLGYYLILESLFGQTVGKMITKTKVTNNENEKPNFFRVLMRTLLRFNNLDTMSYLFGSTSQGAHDVLLGTKLIKK